MIRERAACLPLRESAVRLFALAGVWLAFDVALATVYLGERSWWPYLTLLGVGVTCVFAAHLARISLGSFATALLPRSWSGGALGAIIGVSLVVAVARLPSIVRSGYKGLTGPTYSLEEADLQPLSVSAPSEAIAAAAGTIPRDATYSVAGGDKYDVWAVSFLRALGRRRQTTPARRGFRPGGRSRSHAASTRSR